MRKSPFVSVLTAGFLSAIATITAVAATNPAVVPTLRNDWLMRHEGFVTEAKAGNVDVLFTGDSITDGWRLRGKKIWDQKYAPLKAVNFGISGDKTEHVLWRLQNGEMTGIMPKVAVVMIGTNNVGRDSAPQIAEGITAVVQEILKHSPSTKVLLLAVFPRGNKPDYPPRAVLAQVNATIAKLDDGKHIFYLDIGKGFLQPDGTLSETIMPDFLHPNEEGYRIWADAMAPKLAELLGTK